MIAPSFLGGVLLGLASAPHCLGMCGGIGAMLGQGLSPDTASPWTRLRPVLTAQLGKAVAYAIPGAILGGVGASLYGVFDPKGVHIVLQYLAGVGLVWVGLSLIGVVPASARFDRLFTPLRRWAWTRRRQGDWAALLAGVFWGLTPCGMVYSALLIALVSGSALGGMSVMLGFGLGVIPAVTFGALGVGWLASAAKGRLASALLGAAIVVMGLATLIWPTSPLSLTCR